MFLFLPPLFTVSLEQWENHVLFQRSIEAIWMNNLHGWVSKTRPCKWSVAIQKNVCFHALVSLKTSGSTCTGLVDCFRSPCTACAAVLACLPDVVAQAWLPSRPGGLQIVFPTQNASYIVLRPIVAYSFPALCKENQEKNSQGPDPSTEKKTARDRTPVPKKMFKKKKKGRAKKKRIQCFCFSLLTREFSYEGLCRYRNESWHDDFGLGLTGLLRWTIAVWWCGQHVSSWCRWSELTG